jgi:hypothetical protein
VNKPFFFFSPQNAITHLIKSVHIPSLFIIDVIAYSFLHGGGGGLSRGNIYCVHQHINSSCQMLATFFFGVSHELPAF